MITFWSEQKFLRAINNNTSELHTVTVEQQQYKTERKILHKINNILELCKVRVEWQYYEDLIGVTSKW